MSHAEKLVNLKYVDVIQFGSKQEVIESDQS